MMVPRAYLNRSTEKELHDALKEKENIPYGGSGMGEKPPASHQQHQASRRQGSLRIVPVRSLAKASAPVQIPKSGQKGPSLAKSSSEREAGHGTWTRSPSGRKVESVLSATTIPARRKTPRRRSQRLPDGDHVASFSRLLLEDVDGADAPLPNSSLANPHFEELFGPLGDSQSACTTLVDGDFIKTPKSLRSMSTESMPSLVMDDDQGEKSPHDIMTPSTPSSLTHRLSSNPRIRIPSPSEVCDDNHPLQQMNVLDPLSSMHEDDVAPPASPKSLLNRKRPSSILRSNLTASLRALRSAAQTVSSLATSSQRSENDDFITRSIFSFTPQLTDDKRPPPCAEPPSPALRRYLNPHPGFLESRSPAELHSYNEQPLRSKAVSRKGRPDSSSHRQQPQPITKSIQLQICIPSPIRSAHASSPPTWLSLEHPPPSSSSSSSSEEEEEEEEEPSPPTFSSSSSPPPPPPTTPTPSTTTTNHLPPRQREPRANAAFLRILVAEMNMRRHGKFADDMIGHARVCLPARKPVNVAVVKTGRERWEGGGGGADG